MHPTANFNDPWQPEELIVAAVGISMDIAPVAIQKIQRPLFAPVKGKIKHSQGRTLTSAHIDPEPGLLYFSLALDLKGNDRVVGENHIPFKDRPLEYIFKRPNRLIGLKVLEMGILSRLRSLKVEKAALKLLKSKIEYGYKESL